MSYTEIAEKLEVVVKKLKSGGQMLQSLCGFLKAVRRATEVYTQQVSKLVEGLEYELPAEDNMDTLSTAILAFVGYFKERVNSFDTLTSALQLEIYEPLELFLGHFTQSNLKWFEEGQLLSREIERTQKLTHKCKVKYYRAAAAAERAEDSKSNEHQQSLTHKALHQYLQAIELTNQKWEVFDARVPYILESLQQSEESRISFLKLSLEKVLARDLRLGCQLEAFAAEATVVVSNINPSIDIRVFVDVNKSKAVSVTREAFTSYSEWKEAFQAATFVEPQEVAVAKAVEAIVPHLQRDGLTAAESNNFAEILENNEGRSLFMDVLEMKRNFKQLDGDSIIQLAAFVKIMLNNMMLQADTDPYVCCKLLGLSQRFFTGHGTGRRHLYSYLQGHPLWMDPQVWIDAIEFAALIKRETDKECIKRQELNMRKKSLVGTLKSLAKKIPQVFQKDETVMRAEKSSIYIITSQFNFHLIRMDLPSALANYIILTVAKNARLDAERTCDLLAEFEANLKTSMTISQARRLPRPCKRRPWGALQLVLKFLHSDTHIELLLVNKEWHHQLRAGVLKTWLLSSYSGRIRNHCWAGLLQPWLVTVDYATVLAETHENLSQLAELADVIDRDVARSYKHNSLISPQVLTNILKAFAYYNTAVGYCQGMNYVAGTLFIQLQDEELAFKCLLALVERFEMADLFVNNLPKLKQFFFQLDRLIAMLLPDLHNAFREVGVCSAHFSSPWFMTIYASTLQHEPTLLYQIWDLFLAKGWKVVFRIALRVLTTLAADLIEADFDEIMSMLSGVSQPNLRARVFPPTMLQDIAEVPISNTLLAKLQDEYKELKLKASSM